MYRGIIPPLVTPLNDRDTLDEEGLSRLIEHLLAGGVDALFLLGTTGEAPSLSYRLRRDLIRQACALVDGRVPVLVGVTDTAFVETIELAEVAAAAGASAAVLSTPYYFPAGQTELVQYIEHVIEALPLPLMLYNMPSLTKVWFEIDTLQKLADHQQIVGVKDSGGDLEYFRQVVRLKRERRPDWSVLIGPEHLLPQAVADGGDGGVSGGANLFPKLFVEAFRAADQGDAAGVARCLEAIEQLQAIYTIGKYASRIIKAIKSGLSLRGICNDQLAEPFNRFQPPERARVEAVLTPLIQAGW